jgi:peptide/nickel transport system substrate-binding protein
MLDEAGYAVGDDGVRIDPETGDRLVIRMPTANDTQGSEAAGKLIAAFLAQIGIEVDVQPVSAGKIYDMQQSGDFDAYIWYWSGDPDPNYQLSVFTSNACGDLSDGCWRDPAYDALVEEQAKALDQEQRLAIVQQAQQYVYDQVPAIPLAYPSALVAYRSDLVTDLVAVPSGDGYLTPGYSYAGLVNARPAGQDEPAESPTSPGASPEASASAGADTQAAPTEPAASSSTPVWIWAVVAVVVIGAIAFLLVRRRSAADRPDTR